MEHGLKFKKLHRITLIEQSSWMKPDIMLNTKLRNPEKNEFKKNFFETMNDSVFRKDYGKYYEPSIHETSGKPRVICQECDKAKI